MSTQVGITDFQARKLIELAEAAGCLAKVRTFRKDTNHTHAGRAFLISVISRTEARIKPFTHRKEEIVPLASLRFWKSGCEFDITEAEFMTEQETKTETKAVVKTRFVIYSAKAEGVWAGSNRKWIKNVQSAIFYRDLAHAESTIKGFSKTYASDAILITDVDATSRLAEHTVNQKQDVPAQPVLIESKTITPVQPTERKKETVTVSDDFALDFDPVAFAKLADDYKRILQELKDLDIKRNEIIESLSATKASLAEMASTLAGKKEKPVVVTRKQVKPEARSRMRFCRF
jgi:hypothetical protein